MKKGDIIKLDYVARVKGTNAIFDLTMRDVAEKEKLDTKGHALKPATVIIGAGQVIKGLDAELEKMSPGEERTVTIPARLGFGERSGKLIKTVPAGRLKGSRVPLVPGTQLNINGVLGRVQSTSGGRVRIDMNHPLAGKDLVYEVKVLERIEEPEKKIEAIMGMHTKEDCEVSLTGQKAAIKTRKLPGPFKEKLAKEILVLVPEVKAVEFLESQLA